MVHVDWTKAKVALTVFLEKSLVKAVCFDGMIVSTG